MAISPTDIRILFTNYDINENHRRELYSNVLNNNAAILSAEDKFVWILSNEDPSCIRELAKFIHSCFQMAP
jgi:hypothetical protein